MRVQCLATLIALFIVGSCQSNPTPTFTHGVPTIAPTTTPTETPSSVQKSVVVISWDGGGADTVYALIDQGYLPHFAELRQQGAYAEYALSVDPSLTAPAQASIASGVYPDRHGIVSNAFHHPADSFYWYRLGYNELLEGVEPIWVSASKAGLKSACLFFVGCSPANPSQNADLTVGYGIRDAYSKLEQVLLQEVLSTWSGEAPQSFSPPLEGSFVIRQVARVYIYVSDSQDDALSNYDTATINVRRAFDKNAVSLHVDEWGEVLLLPRKVAGADFLVQNIYTKDEQWRVSLFYSGVYHNTASPRSLLEEINQRFGYFPAGADSYAVEHNWITPEENLYLIERAASWMAEVTAWLYTTHRPNVLFAWQDGFDAAGHIYGVSQAPHSENNAGRVKQFNPLFLEAVKSADQALATIATALDLNETTLFLVSDHGMAPVHTTVYVNTLLEQAGLLTLDERNYVVVDQSKALAVASGGAAHIYINLKGDERNGIVEQDEYAQIQAQIIELFRGLIDERTGQPVFQRVLAQEDLEAIYLNHLNSGDVFVQAFPGYHLDGWRGKDEVFAPARLYGQHGYDHTLAEMRPFFIVLGAGVPPDDQPLPAVHVVDYAPTIAALLGFTPTFTLDGEPISYLLEIP